MEAVCFYHVWAEGQWETPLSEWMDALARSSFHGPVFLGVVGPAYRRQDVMRKVKNLDCSVVTHAATGYEWVTLECVAAYAKVYEGAILYAHTKGASDPSELNRRWRWSMTEKLLQDFDANLRKLEEVDVVGSHWLDESYPEYKFREEWPPPFFAGNFWVARASYLRKLGQVSRETRFKSESWVASGKPRVHDLLPSWPDTLTFSRMEPLPRPVR